VGLKHDCPDPSQTGALKELQGLLYSRLDPEASGQDDRVFDCETSALAEIRCHGMSGVADQSDSIPAKLSGRLAVIEVVADVRRFGRRTDQVSNGFVPAGKCVVQKGTHGRETFNEALGSPDDTCQVGATFGKAGGEELLAFADREPRILERMAIDHGAPAGEADIARFAWGDGVPNGGADAVCTHDQVGRLATSIGKLNLDPLGVDSDSFASKTQSHRDPVCGVQQDPLQFASVQNHRHPSQEPVYLVRLEDPKVFARWTAKARNGHLAPDRDDVGLEVDLAESGERIGPE
jgi:hypothetical protein